jgi:hypothetical protein
MTDIKRLQDDLNSDPRLLQQFLRDPAGILAGRRIRLSPAARTAIVKSISDQQAAAKKSEGGKVKWELKISGEHPAPKK